MTAQRGKDLLLKVRNAADDAFVTVAGLRARSLSFNAESVDISHSESAGRWRELLSGAGMRRASLSGSGLFKDGDSDERLRTLFFDGAIINWQVIIPDFGILEGPFQITALEYSGNHDNELAFELALESAGLLTFTAL
ncbi:phage major tail protein, TP901-1 family [Cohaesibacter celericrescens]|jgi:TP901-1 family phage major tail protein|uniref:Phage major tail protein, TP901-1 family n=1 Tax=Cohaesibacter celericrescens TaxID=2067669 RepID=A0A2N5XR90_9HYPH|nr:phage major tail protein, TP901-1 family [Cohaesibacter celericrescens]PLW76957.1 phage major tail protein, TP901-1 family [Cohaesibacter celericrescens]